MNTKSLIKSIQDKFISAGVQSSRVPDLVMPLFAKAIGEQFISGDISSHLEILKYDDAINLMSKKKILGPVIDIINSIDFKSMTVPQIMQIEEELKTMFRSMAGEANGQHYTPEDMQSLLVEVLKVYGTAKSVYDPTCGGGNLLQNMAEELGAVDVCGQEYDEQLAAFASIMFAPLDGYQIAHGNTLTDDKFKDMQFDAIASNPPFGTSWKDFAADIDFKYLPKKTDAQMLFIQHIVSKLSESGTAVIIMNGSPMFNGDVNSGESKCRKWLLDSNIVEAWIQLPTDEFYNTPITTYMWVLRKNRTSENITLINAKDWCKSLKKSQGQKRNYIDHDSIERITSNLKAPMECEEVKVLSKYDFYYNKLQLEVKRHEDAIESDKAANELLESKGQKPKKLKEFDKDYEIIPYSPDEVDNENGIQEFLDKWVRREYKRGKSNVGVEVNFNKIFYKPVVLRSTKDIAADIKALDGELVALKGELWG